jgi:hypothetical protein
VGERRGRRPVLCVVEGEEGAAAVGERRGGGGGGSRRGLMVWRWGWPYI